MRAALRVAERDGLDAVTMRNVAAEADLVLGSLRHIYPTRDHLVRAMSHGFAQRETAAAVERANYNTQPETVIGRLLSALPMDEPRLRSWRVENAMNIEAWRNEHFAAAAAGCRKARILEFATGLRTLSRGLDVSAADLEREVGTIVALVEGISLQLASSNGGEIVRAEARSALEWHLVRIRKYWEGNRRPALAEQRGVHLVDQPRA